MAHDVITKIVNEGSSKIVVQVTIVSDGSGELNNYSILDPTSEFTPTMPLGTQLTLTQVWYGLAWFDVAIGFNAIVPTTAWVLARDAGTYYDFRYFGGLKDRSSVDPDGKVVLSTNGLSGNAGAIGTMVLEFKKN